MVLRRTVLDVGSHESMVAGSDLVEPFVVCSYEGSGFGLVEAKTVCVQPVKAEHIAVCDRSVRRRLSDVGISVSQILPAELTTEEKLLVELRKTREAAAALVATVERYFADSWDDERAVMIEPVVWLGSQNDPDEAHRYNTLYNTTASLAETLALGAVYDQDSGQEIGTGITEQPGEKTENEVAI